MTRRARWLLLFASVGLTRWCDSGANRSRAGFHVRILVDSNRMVAISSSDSV